MSADAAAPSPQKTLLVFLTGFGKFRGVPVNPTSQLLASLAEEELALPEDVAFARRDVLDVHRAAVEAYVREATAQAREAVESGKAKAALLLHFGVAAGSKVPRVEEFGWNEDSFAVPDEAGDSPEGVAIEEGVQLGLARKSHAAAIVHDALHSAKAFSLARSRDPGRFICNHMTYVSLRAVHEAAESSGKLASLFVHVPSEKDFPIATSRSMLQSIVEAVAAHVRSAEGAGSVVFEHGAPTEMRLPMEVELAEMGIDRATAAWLAENLPSTEDAVAFLMGPQEEGPTSRSRASGGGRGGLLRGSAAVGGAVGSLGSTDEPLKLVLVVRTDLGMSTGKVAAQCAHAAVGAALQASESSPARFVRWREGGEATICVAAPAGGERALQALERAAATHGVATHSVRDAGRTQVAPGAYTVLAVGPAPVSLVDRVTGALDLL